MDCERRAAPCEFAGCAGVGPVRTSTALGHKRALPTAAARPAAPGPTECRDDNQLDLAMWRAVQLGAEGDALLADAVRDPCGFSGASVVAGFWPASKAPVPAGSDRAQQDLLLYSFA
ncbi:MAG: hypothetical protein QOE17_1306 [Gaiellales bacterium]|nr:hypothetical protein [Gaiellales bacterium]